MVNVVLLGLFSYLLGSVPTLALVGMQKRRQSFVRRSPFIHAVGMKRGLKIAGIDFGKGFVATVLGLIAAGWGGACFAALTVNVGAAFPVFNGFRGMRSVGVAAGSLLVLSPLLLLVGLGTFILVLFLTQYLSLSAILSTVIVLILAVIYPPSWLALLVIVLLGASVLFLYRDSFSRLMKGREPIFPIRRLIR